MLLNCVMNLYDMSIQSALCCVDEINKLKLIILNIDYEVILDQNKHLRYNGKFDTD